MVAAAPDELHGPQGDMPCVGSARVEEACSRLSEAYREADLGNHANPLTELVYICLTRQTHEKNASRAWNALMGAGGVPALRVAAEDRLITLLWPFGLANQKVRWLRAAFALIEARFGQLTLDPLHAMADSDAERFLLSLPGVSIKTARCVMMYSLHRDVLPVDTHVRRVVERLGWVSPGLSERDIHRETARAVPPRLRRAFHINAIWHGRKICLARTGRCDGCMIRHLCANGASA